jgi:hypothetical protein
VQGWTLNGWQQMNNQIAARYLVQYAVYDSNNPTASRVERLIGPADNATNGSWSFTLVPGELFILAISGANEETDLPSFYSLSIQSNTSMSQPTAEATPGATPTADSTNA